MSEEKFHSAGLCWCGHSYHEHFSNHPDFGCIRCMENDPELFGDGIKEHKNG